jgi:4-amino-4-deoxy-L-arabinose transferase-like glycosyltransferase
MTLILRGRLSLSAVLLIVILVIALVARLMGYSFGLPSLYDPDEPFFVITGLKLLRDHTLDPGWFGHPGTTTIYILALIELCVVGVGLASGRFADVHAFGQALYTDPSMIFVPARLFIVLCGVGCVALTFLIGRRLFDDRVGLSAAALLALNPLHIQFSQIIRTDIEATVFLLLCMLQCIAIARRGEWANYLLAALFLGLACATKWPAATVGIAMLGASLSRCFDDPAGAKGQMRRLVVALGASVAALLLASPYLLLDYRTVLHDLNGEAQATHLGATGGTLITNLIWYAAHPLRDSVGVAGVALTIAGLVLAAARDRKAAATMVAATLAFVLAISSQRLIWSRWIVPLLPFVSVFMAVALWGLVDALRNRAGPLAAHSLAVAGLVALLLPMTVTAAAAARERRHDTRAVASAWAKAHIPPGSTVLVEYLALDLLPQRWRFIYPAGLLGCIDGNKALKGQIRKSTVGDWRGGREIIDIGTIDPRRLDQCRADYAIFTDYDRYLAERNDFPQEVSVYQTIAKNGILMLTVRPSAGEMGGPVVRIVRLGQDRRPVGPSGGGAPR